MVFTIDQLNRFKDYAHRAMVKVEEWKNNRDVQVANIAQEIQCAFSEGYYTAMHEVRSTPWEYAVKMTEPDLMNAMAGDGWEFVAVFSEEDMGHAIWRRRKAVAKIAAEEKES